MNLPHLLFICFFFPVDIIVCAHCITLNSLKNVSNFNPSGDLYGSLYRNHFQMRKPHLQDNLICVVPQNLERTKLDAVTGLSDTMTKLSVSSSLHFREGVWD